MAHKHLTRRSGDRSQEDQAELLNGGVESTQRIFSSDRSNLNTSLQEQLVEKDLLISKLQVDLRSQKEQSGRLLSLSRQQGAELKRREQQLNRIKEKLTLQTLKHRAPAIEMLNVLPKRAARREPCSRAAKTDERSEEALRLLLERREAELREAMKLRHGLTTLLHMFRNNMTQTIQDVSRKQRLEEEPENNVLVQSEKCLGDHVTGGVVQEWTHVQRRLRELMLQGTNSGLGFVVESGIKDGYQGTNQEKLLVHLEEELQQSQQLIRKQQDLLHDNVNAPLPAVLMDSYYLEEWERLQGQWEELKRQRWSFQRERQAFTDAAIRLGHERTRFEQQKASRLKSDFLSFSPVERSSRWSRRESTALSELRPDPLTLSPCFTPGRSEVPLPQGSHQTEVMTPNTPELYSALRLPYHRSERILQSAAEHMNWLF
ncbi:hypothetical protein DNTS_030170 [Danionella cerebrum]|uniref:Afadin- and alpha-actinin-binding protein-like n=1 Tax=Danionella cerebrum TaxID=2873325 RepID=A0A553Q816_9TELE|nr:hypothetical protein DNTS_030170 [Danionella translucida]